MKQPFKEVFFECNSTKFSLISELAQRLRNEGWKGTETITSKANKAGQMVHGFRAVKL